MEIQEPLAGDIQAPPRELPQSGPQRAGQTADQKPLARRQPAGYTEVRSTFNRRFLKFYGFSADYLQRLADGDRSVEEHFTAYFGELIFLKLRSQLHSTELIEDIRQETLLRVIRTFRSGRAIEHPERFGAFVNAVCNNVMKELIRKEYRHDPISDGAPEPHDDTVDLDRPLVNEERKHLVESILAELPSRDQQVLRLLYLDEKPPSEVSRQLGVDDDYLRVLVHRAKSRFKNKMASVRSAGG